MPTFHFRRLYSPTTPPETSLSSLVHGLRKGHPFQRPLTQHERLTLALAGTEPHSHLTLTSAALSRAEVAKSWRLFRQRLVRESKMPDALVYLAVPARSLTADGYHLHVLVWNGYLHLSVLKGHARATGFGDNVRVERIRPTVEDYLRVTSYVLGQQTPVFGRGQHVENGPVERSKRRYLRPHDTTLNEHAPEVLHALELATSQAVTDEMLVSASPFFSKSMSRLKEGSIEVRDREITDTKNHEVMDV
jgi:hypothetical protein